MTLTLNGTVETLPAQWMRVATVAEVQEKGSLTVHAGGNVIVLFKFDRDIYAVDNRCPHMGFPLDKGSVHNGILTCHWHHARFDLKSGGTFDLWADDVRNFPVHVIGWLSPKVCWAWGAAKLTRKGRGCPLALGWTTGHATGATAGVSDKPFTLCS
jgi:nitrite reductase/ring-hydroxylating ferredoxin subunit